MNQPFQCILFDVGIVLLTLNYEKAISRATIARVKKILNFT